MRQQKQFETDLNALNLHIHQIEDRLKTKTENTFTVELQKHLQQSDARHFENEVKFRDLVADTKDRF